MAAKAINLGPGLQFSSIAEAKAHFGKILADTPVDQHVTSQEFDALRVLYEASCAKTNWSLPSPPKAFFPRYEKQKKYSTKCFGVEFEDGKDDRFSFDKALSAVANT